MIWYVLVVDWEITELFHQKILEISGHFTAAEKFLKNIGTYRGAAVSY